MEGSKIVFDTMPFPLNTVSYGLTALGETLFSKCMVSAFSQYPVVSNPLNREMIRPQYRDFLTFGERDKLFKILGDKTRELYNFVKLINIFTKII